MNDPSMVLKVSSGLTAGYAVQMAGIPDTAADLYFKKHVPRSSTISRWFGHALAFGAARDFAASKNPTKAACQAAAGQWLTAPVIMGIQAKNGDMKPEMAVANGLMCAAIGFACVKAGEKCSK
ncbi:hypothetical protein RI054_17g80190 [Pseudoscourfieldia marina]